MEERLLTRVALTGNSREIRKACNSLIKRFSEYHYREEFPDCMYSCAVTDKVTAHFILPTLGYFDAEILRGEEFKKLKVVVSVSDRLEITKAAYKRPILRTLVNSDLDFGVFKAASPNEELDEPQEELGDFETMELYDARVRGLY